MLGVDSYSAEFVEQSLYYWRLVGKWDKHAERPVNGRIWGTQFDGLGCFR